MTELLYQTDSFLQEFDATVVAIETEPRSVILNRTVFYPGGGGQPCDTGVLTIGGMSYPVARLKKQGDREIVCTISLVGALVSYNRCSSAWPD